jgi:GT2 family glycosyltransferase
MNQKNQACQKVKYIPSDNIFVFLNKSFESLSDNLIFDNDDLQKMQNKKIINTTPNIKVLFGGYCPPKIDFNQEYAAIHNFVPEIFITVKPAFVRDSLLDAPNSSDGGFNLNKDQILCFDTYFNSFYYSIYEKIISSKDYYAFILFKGNISIEIFSRTSEGIEDLMHKSDASSDIYRWLVIPVPTVISSVGSCRIYFRFIGIDSNSHLKKISLSTKREKNDTKLVIALRTNNRRRDCIRVVKQILGCEAINAKNNILVLLDASESVNQITKEDFSDCKINLDFNLILTPNYGSSGNLARLACYIRDCKKVSERDVVLIIDDDIVFDNESILRAKALLDYSGSRKIAIASSFLDKCRPLNIDSTIGIYQSDENTSEALRLVPLRGGNRIDDQRYLDYSSVYLNGNIAAFYFLIIHYKLFDMLSPIPFFLKWDDIDYTHRIAQEGYQITNVPGISIWHDAFYDCMPSWQEVLNLRHGVITDLVRLDIELEKVFNTVLKIIFTHLNVFDYILVKNMVFVINRILDCDSCFLGTDFLKQNSIFINNIRKDYCDNISNTAKIFPDSSIIFDAYDTGRSLSISGHQSEFVHELFPDPKDRNLKCYIKISRKSEKYYLLKYNKEDHEIISNEILKLIKKVQNSNNVASFWKQACSKFSNFKNWESIFSINETNR